MRSLELLPGFSDSRADGINGVGQIAGPLGTFCPPDDPAVAASRTRTGELVARLGRRIALPPLTAQPPGGRMVAPDDLPACFVRAALWAADGTPTLLGGLSERGASVPSAVNDAGQVVGFAVPSDGDVGHAFLWEHDAGMQDLGTLGGVFSFATDINDAGRVVGTDLQFNGAPTAFIWERRTGMVELGGLPGHTYSFAAGVNDAGYVVGSSFSDVEPFHGFLWHPTAGALDLGEFVDPVDLNDAGHVVANVNDVATLLTVQLSVEGSPAVSRLLAGTWAPGHPSGLSGVWLRVRLVDRGDAGPWKWTLNWGDGVVHTPTVARKGEFVFLRRQAYTAPGPHTITAVATDPTGATSAVVTTTVP